MTFPLFYDGYEMLSDSDQFSATSCKRRLGACTLCCGLRSTYQLQERSTYLHQGVAVLGLESLLHGRDDLIKRVASRFGTGWCPALGHCPAFLEL